MGMPQVKTKAWSSLLLTKAQLIQVLNQAGYSISDGAMLKVRKDGYEIEFAETHSLDISWED